MAVKGQVTVVLERFFWLVKVPGEWVEETGEGESGVMMLCGSSQRGVTGSSDLDDARNV